MNRKSLGDTGPRDAAHAASCLPVASLLIWSQAALNIGLSGIPWRTTDIGGFHGGDIDDPSFRELLVRWFQCAVFCPIMRLHGVRRQAGANIQPGDPIANPEHPNVANEVWSYGEETWAVLSDRIRLRERLRPCVMKQKKLAETTSLPPMRPLFVDFPDDPHAWVVEDQFLFGSELLVAPILSEGARSRTVFLRDGSKLRLSGA